LERIHPGILSFQEELCRLGDELSVKGQEADEVNCPLQIFHPTNKGNHQNLRDAIEQARMRRSKRAEAARIKYQVNSGQRNIQ
jgi:hypothetical protein